MTAQLQLPTDHEIASEPDKRRRAILGAMQRILTGRPRHVPPGRDSVSQLAIEAGVGRHHLYQRNPDLRVRFERLRETGGQRTSREVELQRRLDDAVSEVRRLTILQSQTHHRTEQWKGLVDTLQRAINVLQEELRTEEIRSQRLEKRLGKVQEQGGLPAPVLLRSRTKAKDQ